MSDASVEPPGATSPYVGLVPYSEDDAEFFFGRDEEKRIVAANLRASRLTIVYGSSGVGKTSLLRAGVVHDLRVRMLAAARERPERAPFAVCIFSAWRDDPLRELMAVINAAATEALGGRELPRWRPGEPVVPALRAWTERVRTLLVVLDQFEDYFLYHSDENGADDFADQLVALVNEPNLRVNLLLSIRDDAWAKLDRFEGRIPHLFANYIRVEHLGRNAAREAIELPIAEWNRRLPPDEQPYRLEPALVDAVIDAAADGGLAPSTAAAAPPPAAPGVEVIEAPFLQLVMQRLWNAAVVAGSHELTLVMLDRLGGAQQIVENHVLGALGALTPSEQAIASSLFRFLVTRSRTKIAHSATDLAEWTGTPEPEVTAVLDKLCRGDTGRILRRVLPPAGDGGSMRYELFHDVLAEPILDWRLGYEQEQARRAAVRRLLRVGGVLLSLVAIFAALGIWALVQRSDAKRATRSASSLALASEAASQTGGGIDRALLLALEAYRTRPTAEASSAMVAALGSPKLSDVEAILRGGSIGVRAVAFSPDRRTFASADFDGTVRLWDLRARAPLGHPLRENIGQVWTVAFDRSGRTLAVAGFDGTVRLWDVRSRTVLASVRSRSPGAVRSVAFSPKGTLLASAGDDGSVWLRDPRTLEPLGEPLRSHSDRIISIAFDPDGRTLASAGADHVIRLWDVHSRKLVAQFSDAGRGPVLSVAFSPNGRTLAASSEDGTVRLWDLTSLHQLGAPLDARSGAAWGIAFSSDGRTLAVSGFDATVRLWDVRARRQLAVLRSHSAPLTSIAFSPDGHTVASGSYDGTVRLWAVPVRPRPLVLRGSIGRVVSVAFSPDGRVLASGGFDRTLHLWDVASGAELGRLTLVGAGAIESIAFAPDGGTIGSGGDDGLVRLWQVQGRRLLGSLRARGGAIHDVSYSPDGKLLAVGADDGRLRIWDVRQRRLLASLTGHTGSVWSVAFSPDGRMLASAGLDGTVRLWDVRALRPVSRLPLASTDQPLSLAFSPDGRMLAVGEVGGAIRLRDLRRHQWAGQPLQGPVERVERVAFSPSGRTLVSAADDGRVRLWDVREHKQLGRPLVGGTGAVYGVAFSPDGRAVASGDDDGTVRLWHGILWRNFADLRAMVCKQVVGNLTRSEWASLVPGLAYRTSCPP
jgi:WD40 repeat protein